jgi:hypothetical protein
METLSALAGWFVVGSGNLARHPMEKMIEKMILNGIE